MAAAKRRSRRAVASALGLANVDHRHNLSLTKSSCRTPSGTASTRAARSCVIAAVRVARVLVRVRAFAFAGSFIAYPIPEIFCVDDLQESEVTRWLAKRGV